MVRTLLYLFLSIILITFIRMVIGIIMRSMGEMLNPKTKAANRQSSGASGPQAVPISGELKRDPVCGTFVPSSTSFQKLLNGQTYYYCSAACRDKHT